MNNENNLFLTHTHTQTSTHTRTYTWPATTNLWMIIMQPRAGIVRLVTRARNVSFYHEVTKKKINQNAEN
jgi:hypothetical protein